MILSVHTAEGIIMAAYVVCLLVIAREDWLRMRIPNRMVAVMIAIGILCTVCRIGPDLTDRCLGFFVVSLPMFAFALVRPGSFGGGDIKLLAAAGFVQGWQQVTGGFMIGALLAGIWSLILVIVKKKERKDKIPFGPFLSAGFIAVIFCTP